MVIWLTFDEEISKYRAAFERFLKEDPESPLTEEQKAGLNLQFFSPDEKYCVEAALEEFSKQRQKELVDKEGFPRKLIRFGKLRFELDGITCALEVFKDPEQDMFLAPFNDATSGKETYASGRYIDLEENTSGIYDLDFNRAYNPYCAYNNEFSCPLPPAENTLSVPIRAGEKQYVVDANPL